MPDTGDIRVVDERLANIAKDLQELKTDVRDVASRQEDVRVELTEMKAMNVEVRLAAIAKKQAKADERIEANERWRFKILGALALLTAIPIALSVINFLDTMNGS